MLTDDSVTYPEIQKKILPEAPLRNVEPVLTLTRRMAIAQENVVDRLRELNSQRGAVHRWYTLLQDFPSSLVWDKIMSYGIKPGQVVLDPFCGSGTTLVTSKMMGLGSIGIDVNPVAHFVTLVKCQWEIDLENFKKTAINVLKDFYAASCYLSEIRLQTDLAENMTQLELNQWLKTNTQNEVGYLRERIKEINEKDIRQLLQLVLVSAAIDSSNVAFCPGTTFYPFRKRETFSKLFEAKLAATYDDLQDLQQAHFSYGKTDVLCADCRKMSVLLNREIDFIFTSPPYPNDLEYTRQTRLELYLLDFVQNMQGVQKIKREMVKGSTKLVFEDSNSADLVREFSSIQIVANAVEQALKGKKWGWDYPRMIKEYFGDMYLVLAEMLKVLRRDGWALLVVGDQTCKGVLIPVGSILCELASHLGFSQVGLETLRIRRSTIHTRPLKEEILILRK
jgi:DNA modification methylase